MSAAEVETLIIEVLVVDRYPHDEYLIGGQDPQEPDVDWRLAPEFATLPAVWLAELDLLVERTDCAQCALCEAPVGAVLHEDDEGRPGYSGLRWNTAVLAREDGGRVVWFCEDCHPSVEQYAPREDKEVP